MKLSLCNEVIRELPFARQCALAAGLGYAGLEVAPFTFGDEAYAMSAAARADIRNACSASGIALSGLHWLLAAPSGLSITSADRTTWQKSVDVLRALVELCAELEGDYLVHGSPAQRRVTGPDEAKRAEEAWRIAASEAGQAGVTYCIEPLARPDCNFVNTLAEAADMVRRNGNPALRMMIDTLAASHEEPEPVADAIRRWMPSMCSSTTATGAGRGRATIGSRRSCRRSRIPAMPAGWPWNPSSTNPMVRPAPRA